MYKKEELVIFLKWNSNIPVGLLNKSSKEELEDFITRKNVWGMFEEQLEVIRMEIYSGNMNRMIKKMGR